MDRSSDTQRLREGLLAAAPLPDAGFAARIFAAQPDLRQRHRLWPAAVVVALALAVVGGLLIAGYRSQTVTRVPSTEPTTRTTPAPTPASTPAGAQLAPETLRAAGLENVASLVVPLNVTTDNGGNPISLVAAYSDPARTVVVVRGISIRDGPGFGLADSHGLINSAMSSGSGAEGDAVVIWFAGLRADRDGKTDLRLQGQSWSLAARIPVQESQALAAPADVTVGGVSFHLATVGATPNCIHIVVLEQGAGLDQLNPPPSTFRLTGPDGSQPRQLSGSGAVTTPKDKLNAETAKNVRLEASWLRGAAGTYKLTISYAGDQKTIDLTVP
jgi:hypothetical protein